MTRARYWILNAASLLVAALIGLEMHAVHQMDDVTALLQQAQAPIVAAQQDAPRIQRLIQRTALGATRDPALKSLLAKYGISVTRNQPPATAPAALPTSHAASVSPPETAPAAPASP